MGVAHRSNRAWVAYAVFAAVSLLPGVGQSGTIQSPETRKTAVRPADNPDRTVLVVDIGGTSVKVLASRQKDARRFPSGPTMTPAQMVSGVKKLTLGWKYDAVSIGYPGRIQQGKVVSEPHNLASGWVGFDFEAAFGCPVRIVNDAVMQALGSYKGGTMLFLGFGTGLGSALIVEGTPVPMELGHLSYKDATYEDFLGIRGVERLGPDEWEKEVRLVVARLIDAFHADDFVLGGGNVERLKGRLPPGCRAGRNDDAFLGGFLLWQEPLTRKSSPAPR